MKVKEKRLLGDKDYPLGHSLLEWTGIGQREYRTAKIVYSNQRQQRVLIMFQVKELTGWVS